MFFFYFSGGNLTSDDEPIFFLEFATRYNHNLHRKRSLVITEHGRERNERQKSRSWLFFRLFTLPFLDEF